MSICDAGFFYAYKPGDDGKRTDFGLIAVELAKYFGVDPEVMMRKPISQMLKIRARTFKYEEQLAEHRRVEELRREAERR
jgi:hypothetical protein